MHKCIKEAIRLRTIPSYFVDEDCKTTPARGIQLRQLGNSYDSYFVEKIAKRPLPADEFRFFFTIPKIAQRPL
jgi:hypothetical protein